MARRIAIVHYTLPPAIGGIESMIEAQVRALNGVGYQVRLIGARGGTVAGAETVILQSMDPQEPSVVVARTGIEEGLPGPSDPAVRGLRIALEDAMQGCDAVCVHNALTLDLNPLLTAALFQLIRDCKHVCWSIWCEDISAASGFSRSSVHSWPRLADLHRGGAQFVTVSTYRARQMEGVFDLPPGAVEVVQPPVNLRWLGFGRESMSLIEELHLLHADPLVVVPSKLLPHKGLTRAVDVAQGLAMKSPTSMVIVTGASSPHEAETSAALARELGTRAEGLRDGAFVIAADVFGGELMGGTVRDLMMMADVVYVPSCEEGFGMTLREAAALRVPVVATDIPAFRESGDGWAIYVPDDAPAERVVAVIEEIMGRSAREARVRALRSSETFRRDVIDLLVPSSSGEVR